MLLRLSLLMALAGCIGCGPGDGSRGATVSGKVLKGTAPLPDSSQAILWPSEGTARYVARIGAADGTVQFADVLPGTYKLVVYAIDSGALSKLRETTEAGRKKAEPIDQLRGAFGPDRTRIAITVEGSDIDFGTIDLDDPSTWTK